MVIDMKKILSFFICAVLISCVVVPAKAVEYSYDGLYSIDLPEEYTEIEAHKFTGQDDSAFSVTVDENDEKKSYADMSEKEVLEYGKALEEDGTQAFKLLEKDGKMELVSAEKVKHPDGKTAIVTVIRTSVTENGKTASHLQKMYEFSCNENVYRFIYTADKDEDVDNLNDAFNSIKIEEAEIKSTTDKIVDILALCGLLLLLFIGIFKFIRGRKR